MSQPPFCSLVIPTKDAGALFQRVLGGLQAQTFWKDVEFIVVDSGSRDDTVALARAAGARVFTIPPHEFNHGATRDFAIAQASSPYVVLSVQDATPDHPQVLEKLVAALKEDGVAGVYARQIPYPDADVITARNLNLHVTGRMSRDVHHLPDAAAFESLTPMEKYIFCNFDNVCAAIRKDVWELEKFGRINFGEDIDWAERVLKRGYKTVYEPAAAVVHSHDRPVEYEYKRTYVCHRKLISQFGLRAVPTLGVAVAGWFRSTLADMLYVLRTEKDWGRKVAMLMKVPVLNYQTIRAQLQAARDDAAGAVKHMQGV